MPLPAARLSTGPRADALRFMRYACIGSLATATHYAVLVASTEKAGLAPGVGAGAGAIVGAAVSYLLNGRFTFGVAPRGRSGALPRFAVVALLCAALSASIVQLAVSRLGVPYLWAQGLATVLGLLIGFALHQHWTFA